MNNLVRSGYDWDILDQPAALEAHASQALPAAIASLDLARFDRIILTGMGSSDYATIPFELQLARLGLPVWRVQTGRLLEMPQLIAPQTLLWMTSQSGRSGETVALIDRLRDRETLTMTATTNDPVSPLAKAADPAIGQFFKDYGRLLGRGLSVTDARGSPGLRLRRSRVCMP